jgi:hypothetical protein
VELRGASVRPLMTAGDRLSEARTGAHRAHSVVPERARGTPDRSSQPSVPSSSATSARRGRKSTPRRPSPRRCGVRTW